MFKIPCLTTSGKPTAGATPKSSPQLRPPLPLTPAQPMFPPLRRTEKIYPLPKLDNMVRPTLEPAVQQRVLKKAVDTINQEKSQNTRAKTNPTLAMFSPVKNSPAKSPTTPKSRLSKKSPTKRRSVVNPPDPNRNSSPYQYEDESPPSRLHERIVSPETSKARKRMDSSFESITAQAGSQQSYKYPECITISSSSQSSPEQDYLSDTDVDSSHSEHSEAEEEVEVFEEDPDFATPAVRRNKHPGLPSGSRNPLQLPVKQYITPHRDEDGDIDFSTIDFKRRICDYDAPARYVIVSHLS